MANQIGLFNDNENTNAPLAYEVRPTEISHYFGQVQLRSKLDNINYNNLPHIVFYGPPGTGKTTLAKIMASSAALKLYDFNAVMGGVNDLRALIKDAIGLQASTGERSIIFIDEIHRFNKSQQDALLPYLEKGDFILFGATTEYPKTSLNKALLSRIQVWELQKLDEQSIEKILFNALEYKEEQLDPKYIELIVKSNNGDARSALNQLEELLQNKDQLDKLDIEDVKKNYLFNAREYDRNSNRHYDVISAFIKSIRGSDPNSAILWLAIMLEGGEDPEFIARRLMISASEDIGNADPRALQVATSAHYVTKNIGMPEARITLAQAVTYLAHAPKSNASYLAINEAMEFVKNNKTIEVPTHLRNHHPDKSQYKYPHSYPNHYTEQSYNDEKVTFYQSSELGYERMMNENLKKMKS